MRATDANGCNDSIAYSLAINCPTITLAPPTLPSGTAGSPYSQTITASGGIGASTFTLASGALPAGITLSSSGALTGTPTVTGAFSFRVRATDANGCNDSLAYSLAINCPVITLAPPTLPAGTAGSAYSQTVTASGGIGSFTFTLASGALPAGITLSPSGALTGTPTVTGAFSFRVRATDANGCNDSLAYSLAINCPVITLAPPTLPAGTTGSAYNQTISATGGIGTSTFALASGALPAGLTLSAAGALTGTPTANGAFSFRVRATDANGCSDSLAYSLTINCPVITLAPPTVPTGTTGSAYSQAISATGGNGTSKFTLTSGALPAGMTLSASGALTGTPTVNGTFSFSITATDTFGCTGSLAYSLTIGCPVISLSPPTLPVGTAGSAFSQTIVASGGSGPYSFSILSGALPAGMTLAAGGSLSGTPTASGSFIFAVRATDANGCNGSLGYSLTVNCPAIALSPLTLPGGLNGIPYNQTVSASGGTAPYTFTSGGTLPVGLALSSGGILAGTPTANGGFSFIVVARDANGCSDTVNYVVSIGNCPVASVSSPFPNGSVGQAYSSTIAASGGVAPYTYAHSAGTLPPGLTFLTNQLGGTPTAPGKYQFQISIQDANFCTTVFSDTVIICGAVALSPSLPIPAGTAGSAYSQSITASGSSAPYGFAVTSGSLPAGLTLSSSGALSGTPTVTGAFSFTVTATDAFGCTGSRAYSLTISCPVITLAPPTLPVGTTGSAYNQTITASGGLGTSTFTLSSGTLPAGLGLSSSGTLVGTPTVSGAFSFRVRTTDANGCSDSLAYTLTINCATITFTAAPLPAGFLSTSYSTTVTATGGTVPITFSVIGSLPTGLAISTGGAISGSPTISGKYVFTLKATDLYGCTVSRLDSIIIMAAGVTSVASGDWNAGTTWSQGVKPGPTQNVVISGGNTVALSAGDSCASVTVLNGGVLDIGIFTLGLSGTYTLLPGAEGRQSATNPVPGRGATPWLFDAASTYTIGGASTGFGIGAAPGITFGNLNWSTSAAAAPPAGTVIMGNLVLNGTGEMQCGTGTTSRTTTVHGNVIVNSGTLVASNATAPAAGAIDIDGDLTINASGTLRGVNADGSGTVRIGGSLVNIGGKIRVGDGSGDTGNFIIYFKGTAAGMISPGDSSAFRTVAIAPGRTMTLTDTLRVNATYAVVDSGALYCGTNTIAGAGGFTMVAGATIGTGHPSGISRTTGAGTVSVTGPRTFPGAGAGSFEYNGTVAQLATDSTLFSAARLIINNPAGVSLINDFYVSNQLILQSGTVTMIGGKVLSVGATATVPRGSGHVIGRLSKWIPAGTSVTQTYDVGDATAYAPVDLTFHDVTLADSLIVVTTPGEHPNLSSSGVVASRDINRYFTIVNRGVGFGTADAIFHFAPGDVDPGANTSVFLVAKYDAPSWIYPAVGARTGTATQVTGLTSFSDFAVGEVLLQTISVTQTANGVIAPGTTTIVNGATQSFSITPNPGFIVDSVFADGIYRPDLTTSVTFTNVTASHTLTATFVAPTYTITVTQGANGVIAPGTSVVAVHGTQSFSITPNAGYHLDSLIVDGVRVPGAASYTLTNLRAPHSLRASFVVTTFTISVKQGANGVIAPGTSVVQQFSSKSFTITPNTGYHLDSLLVDGARVDSTVSYTFRAVGAAHTLRAVFAINVYSLTVSTVGSGTVKVAPNQSTYTHGSALTLTALADVGWAFSFWSDGASGSANPLGISMTSNENIIATFVQDSSYQNFFRSFAPESIIVARDNHGYLGKSVNRTPDKVDFKFLMTLPADSIRLTLRFTAICSGAITKGTTKLDTLFRWKNRKYITGLVKMPTDSTIQVSGRSVTGLPVRTTFDWSTRPAHTKGIVGTYVENDPRLPMPNRVNVLEETFAQGGFASTLGLLVGLDRTIDSSRHFGWLLAPRYADVIRTLYDAREAVQHKGQPRGLDVFLDGKPIIGRQRSIYPTKHNNKLLAEMVAVKLNIVASALEMIPLGFGELVYNDGTSNPLNGLMVKQIAALADTLMMGRYAFNVHLFADSAVYANLYATLDTINDAFEGPIDTVDFGAALHLTGVRRLQDVPYLRAGTVPPSRIVPRIIPELAEPIGYQLAQNYPNPFNPTTTISFELPIPSRVSLKIYNMLGQEVATLIDNEELEDGTHDMIFNASELATGVYFYRLTAESVADANQQDQQGYFTSVKKMLLIK